MFRKDFLSLTLFLSLLPLAPASPPTGNDRSDVLPSPRPVPDSLGPSREGTPAPELLDDHPTIAAPAIVLPQPNPGPFSFVLQPEVGFSFVQPRFGKRLGGTAAPEDLTYGVAFYPKVELTFLAWPPPEPTWDEGPDPVKFVVSASYLRLEGHLDQQTTLAAGSTRVQADSQMDLFAADVVGLKCSTLKEGTPENHCWLLAEASIRYASIDQRFTSQTSRGSAIASALQATQGFNGIGVSAAAGLRIPVLPPRKGSNNSPLKLYADMRGSLLIGNNRKTSTFQAPGIDTITIQEDERDIIPVCAVELGFTLWEVSLNDLQSLKDTGKQPTVVGIKVAAVGQVWGDVGYISAARPATNRFDSDNLYLYGGLVTFYLKW